MACGGGGVSTTADTAQSGETDGSSFGSQTNGPDETGDSGDSGEPTVADTGPTTTGPETACEEVAAERFAQWGYPSSPRGDVVDEYHGTEVADPFRWLEDPEPADVQQWMDDQHAVTLENIRAIPFRDALRDRVLEISDVDQFGITQRPPASPRIFQYRKPASVDRWALYVQDDQADEPRPLIDPNLWEQSVTLGATAIDPTGEYVAYGETVNNADAGVVRILEVGTDTVRADEVIEDLPFAEVTWDGTGAGFFYQRFDDTGYYLYYHALGSSPDTDTVVSEHYDWTSGFGSEDGSIRFLQKWTSFSTAELYVQDVRGGAPENFDWQPVPADETTLLTPVYHDDFLYMLETSEAYPLGRVVRTELENIGSPEQWQEIVPETDGASIWLLKVVGDRLVLGTTQDVQDHLLVYELDGTPVAEAPLPTAGTIYGVDGNFSDSTVAFQFESYSTPSTLFSYDVATGESTTVETREAPEFDADDYTVELVHYTSPSVDGGEPVEISMYVVRRSDVPLDGSAPALLYGYGGFSLSELPFFMNRWLPWLEAGGVFAHAHLRGGAEYGEQWHQAGALLNKQNTFNDMIAGAEFLVEQGYTSSDRLAIKGGSNGGLTVGAVMTQRPDLIRAVSSDVPLLDMIRSEEIGVGEFWISEYGSHTVPEQFEVLNSYSPYHVAERNGCAEYPSVLFMSADSDDRVDPLHARKMAASVQELNSSENPVLLYVEDGASHGGSASSAQQAETTADNFSFLMRETGLTFGAN